MNDEIVTHVKDASAWMRLLFMLLFAVFYSIAEIVILVVVVFQFLCKLVTGKTHDRALSFGSQLSAYVYQVFRYLTYNTEERPFPFAEWPADTPLAVVVQSRKPGRPRKKAAATGKKAKAETTAKPAK